MFLTQEAVISIFHYICRWVLNGNVPALGGLASETANYYSITYSKLTQEMDSSKQHRLLTVVIILFIALTGFSCNRGYGCPNNFSLDTLMDFLSAFSALPFPGF